MASSVASPQSTATNQSSRHALLRRSRKATSVCRFMLQRLVDRRTARSSRTERIEQLEKYVQALRAIISVAGLKARPPPEELLSGRLLLYQPRSLFSPENNAEDTWAPTTSRRR